MRRAVAIVACVLGIAAFSGCVSSTEPELTKLQERERLKQELKAEILAELRLELLAAKSEVEQQLKNTLAPLASRLDQVTEAQLQDMLARKTTHPQQVAGATASGIGDAEGRILRSGAGLPGCRVKLVRMMRVHSIGEIFKSYEQGMEFETVSDENGKYRFNKLPAGDYKLKWQLPGDTGWIRRIRDKPDVTIMNGRVGALTPIETARALLPR